MNKLIIIEGPQGTGKTTLANFLRENMPGSNLYRLSGQKDKTLTGKQYSEKMYYALLDYLEKMAEIPMDLIFDRTFFTEEVYTRLGYKEYDKFEPYKSLVDKFKNLKFDIYYLSLYLEDVQIFEKRLKREHHNYQSFSLDNSRNQQEVYKNIAEELKKEDINVYEIPMDDPKNAYDKITKILNL